MSKIHQALQRARAAREATLEAAGHLRIRPETMDGLKSNGSKPSGPGLPIVPTAEEGQPIPLSDNDQKCLAVSLFPTMSTIRQPIQRAGIERQTILETTHHLEVQPETADVLGSSESEPSDHALPIIPAAEEEQPILSLGNYEKCQTLPIVPKLSGIPQGIQGKQLERQATVEVTRSLEIRPETIRSKSNENKSGHPLPSLSESEREQPILSLDDYEECQARSVISKIGQERPPNKNGTREQLRSRTVTIKPDPKLVALVSPKANVSEQYRTLRAKILQMQREKGLKTLLVASAGMSEGKTLTAINLALTMAQEIDLKILTVDGDLRRPAVHRFLGIPQALGISDYLSQNCSLESIICSTNLRNFSVVTAGTVAEKPAELLNSSRMDEFLGYTAKKFDWIVLDSPPFVSLADAEVLASKVDGIIFVVRAFRTPTSLFQKSMESLRPKNVLGVVFNGDDDQETSRYSSYYGYNSNRV